MPRLGGHNPLWYDVPSAIDIGDASTPPPPASTADDQLYNAPTGRGASIVETWYQSPKASSNDPSLTGSQKVGKKPLPPPPPPQPSNTVNTATTTAEIRYVWHLAGVSKVVSFPWEGGII